MRGVKQPVLKNANHNPWVILEVTTRQQSDTLPSFQFSDKADKNL